MSEGTRKLFYIIMAFLVSIGAWMFVVYNYYPMTEVSYGDIPISFSGERALAERGLAISSVETEEVRASLNQKRINVNRYSSNDIEVLADVSNCVAGDNSVKVNVSGPSDTSVVSFGPDSVTVGVERTESDFMDIDVLFSSDAPQNTEPVATDLSQSQAEVVCAASKLSEVDRVAAVLSYDEVGEKTKSFTATLVALDKEGNEVPHAVIYPEEVSLDAYSGVTKSVNLTVSVNSKVNDDYDRQYTAPRTITVKGSTKAVSGITSVSAFELDIRYIYEDMEIPIEYDMPEGVFPAADSENAVLKVSVSRKAAKDNSNSSEEDKEDGTD